MKRNRGTALTACPRRQVDRECHLRAITMNPMILTRHQKVLDAAGHFALGLRKQRVLQRVLTC